MFDPGPASTNSPRAPAPIIIVAASMAYIVAQLKGASIVASYLLGVPSLR